MMVWCMLPAHEVQAVGPCLSGCSVRHEGSIRIFRERGGELSRFWLFPQHLTLSVPFSRPQVCRPSRSAATDSRSTEGVSDTCLCSSFPQQMGSFSAHARLQ